MIVYKERNFMTGGKKTFIFVSFVMLISSLCLWAKPEGVIAYYASNVVCPAAL